MAISTIYWVIWGLLLLTAVIIIGLWLYYRSHDYKIRVRQITGTKVKLIFDTVAKIKTDKEKVQFLKFFTKLEGNNTFPIPPQEAIDYDPKKKKKVVEAWYTSEQGIEYIQDKGEITGFQPLTTKQRAMLVNQIRKKEERKNQGWQQHIPLIVGAIAIVAILAILLIFWGDAIEPMHTYASQMETVANKFEAVANKLAAVEQDRQILDGGLPP